MKQHSHDTSKWKDMFKSRVKGSPLYEIMRFYSVNQDLHKLMLEMVSSDFVFYECGSGSGFHSFCFKTYGFKVISTDYDEEVLELICKNAKSLMLDIEIKKFDLISQKVEEIPGKNIFTFSDGVLEHFSPEEMVKAIENQSNAKIISFAVPTVNSKVDESFYGDEKLYRPKKWKKMSQKIFPDRKIKQYPVSHSKIFFVLLRRIVPLWVSKESKYYKMIRFLNSMMLPIENRFAASTFVIIENEK